MKTFFLIFTIIFSVLFSPKALAEEVIPSIISVSESTGSTEGGNTITLSGSNFTGSTVVRIGGVQASTTYVDSSTIQVVVPSGSEGQATISASNGMVAALSNDGYTYVSPAPAPTPTPSPAPTPISSPSPVPPANQSSSPVWVSQPVAPSVVEEVGANPSNVTEPIVESGTTPVVEENSGLIPLSQNSYIVYSDDKKENLVVETPLNVAQKFVLRERVNKKWVYVDKSYSFNNKVVFLDTELNPGSTYKVIVEIQNKKTIVAWFTALEKKSAVS